MSGCFVWTFLLVSCIVRHTAGHLQKPLNVTVESRSFSLFLTWHPDPAYPSFVTYKVQSFDTSNPNKRWKPVSGCENISRTECDITCALNESQFQSHKVRVQTVYPYKSRWAESPNIEYMFAGHLQKPLNVKVESRSFSLFLTWHPDPAYPSFVTYEVQSYDTSNPKERWKPVSGCENISRTECDITCALSESQFQSHKVRVQTVYPCKSCWAESPNIEYMFAVDPEPPYLNVTKEDGSIKIDIHIQRPLCIKEIIYQRMLQYSVMIIRRYNPNEVVCKQETDEPSVTIKTHGYIGEYCVAAKTISRSSNKSSTFSQPFCLNLTQKDEYSSAVFFVPPILIVIGILILLPICVCIYCTSRGKSKEPKALDFSSNKSLQKDPCFSDLYPEVYDSLTIHSISEQDSSTIFLLRNKYYDGDSNYPHHGQGYMERATMQTSSSQSREYFSSKGLAFNSSSDNSSTGCSCPNTSGSVTDMILKGKNDDQSSSCPKEINTNVPGHVQMFSSTSMDVINPGDSLSIMDPNSLVNVPFNTLCIGDENDHIDNLFGESSNQGFTDSEDSLDSFSTDYTISDSRYSSQDEKTHKDCNSGYTQRTYMSRRD